MTVQKYLIEVLSPGSGEVIEGESWVFREPPDYPPGRIYVVEYLDLAEAYIALQRAKAVVVTRGGALSHLSILGREFGVTVVRVDDPAILQIGDGRRMRIDLQRRVLEVML